jgi:tRNA threonylcarbamoyladenosine biosynthesis protein TsaE
MKKVVTNNLAETQKLAAEWVASLTPREDALVVGLYGNLGAGKTSFTQAVAKALGVTDNVNSPTFVIEKIYETKHPIFKRLVHIDAYRLESASELQVLKFEELISNPNNLILIEWPEKAAEILPEDHLKIRFTFVDENTREINIIDKTD